MYQLARDCRPLVQILPPLLPCFLQLLFPCQCISKWSGAHTTTKKYERCWALFIYYSNKTKLKKAYQQLGHGFGEWLTCWVRRLCLASLHFDCPSPENQTVKKTDLKNFQYHPLAPPQQRRQNVESNYTCIICQYELSTQGGKLVRCHANYMQADHLKCGKVTGKQLMSLPESTMLQQSH